jgi:hypothetical protein
MANASSGGVLRDGAAGHLIVGTSPPLASSGGRLRDSTGALVTGTAGALAPSGGFMRDSTGALVTVDYGSAVAPVGRTGGFLRDATGALVTIPNASAVAPLGFSGGVVRDANGALVIFRTGLRLANNGAGGSNGTTVTPANSGGASGAAWDVVSIGASEANTFDNTYVVKSGDLGYKLTTAAAVAANYVAWTTSLGSLSVGQTLSGRFYYVPPASAITSTIRLMHILGGATVLCGIGHVNTVNNIQARVAADAVGGPTTGSALVVGTLYRIEFAFTGIGTAAGTMTISVFAGASTTPLSGYPITASALNFGSLAPDTIRFGICTAAGMASLNQWIASVELDDTGTLPGPE